MLIIEINRDECVGCGKCIKLCPMDAICLVDDVAVIDKDKCINCFVCGEFCELGAIKRDNSWL